MNPNAFKPIPLPLSERLRELRVVALPIVVFVVIVIAVAVLWRKNVSTSAMVGQAETVVIQVSSPKVGTLVELFVTRFQSVKPGDRIGRVMVTDPAVLKASLAVIRSEIEVLRTNLEPITGTMDYAKLRLDWMRQRAALATARVNRQLAETEWHRAEELFTAKIVSQQALDLAKANLEQYRMQVEELSRLVSEGEDSFKAMAPAKAGGTEKNANDPMSASIALAESKLRLTEAELRPIVLTAPIEGTVTAINLRPGETVQVGHSIVSIAALTPARIVAYLRAPYSQEPQRGSIVEIHRRSMRRESGQGRITEIGRQLDSIPAVLLGALKLNGTELGLPVEISVPEGMSIKPGEVVDVILVNRPADRK